MKHTFCYCYVVVVTTVLSQKLMTTPGQDKKAILGEGLKS